jgi:hypothetical protein
MDEPPGIYNAYNNPPIIKTGWVCPQCGGTEGAGLRVGVLCIRCPWVAMVYVSPSIEDEK